MSASSASMAAAPGSSPVAGDLRALVDRCRAGDQAAWRRLISSRAAQVYRWAVLLGLSPTEAEDAGQEVFAVAARRIDTCRADEALGSWLFQITRRVCANHRRRGWWRRWLGGSSAQTDARLPAFEPSTGADEITVRACLAQLSPRLAEVLVLLEVEGFTRDEAAAVLGIPPGTVASRLRLARQAFEALWSEERER